MPKIELFQRIHKNKKVVCLVFERDSQFESEVKKPEAIRWSQSKRYSENTIKTYTDVSGKLKKQTSLIFK